MELKGNHLI